MKKIEILNKINEVIRELDDEISQEKLKKLIENDGEKSAQEVLLMITIINSILLILSIEDLDTFKDVQDFLSSYTEKYKSPKKAMFFDKKNMATA